jgi:hypothetical protein
MPRLTPNLPRSALQAHSRGIRTISASNVYVGDEPGMDETDVAESYR